MRRIPAVALRPEVAGAAAVPGVEEPLVAIVARVLARSGDGLAAVVHDRLGERRGASAAGSGTSRSPRPRRSAPRSCRCSARRARCCCRRRRGCWTAARTGRAEPALQLRAAGDTMSLRQRPLPGGGVSREQRSPSRVAAARREAEIADCSGASDVSAVSTPTNLVNSYDVPLPRVERDGPIAGTASLACFSVDDRRGLDARAGASVEATAPSFVPSRTEGHVRSVAEPLTSRHRPSGSRGGRRAPSRPSVTSAAPLQCGVIVRRTAPTCGLLRAASTS